MQHFVSSKQNKNHKTVHRTKQMTCYATLCRFKNKQTNKMKQNKYIVVMQRFVRSKQKQNETAHKTKQVTCYATFC